VIIPQVKFFCVTVRKPLSLWDLSTLPSDILLVTVPWLPFTFALLSTRFKSTAESNDNTVVCAFRAVAKQQQQPTKHPNRPLSSTCIVSRRSIHVAPINVNAPTSQRQTTNRRHVQQPRIRTTIRPLLRKGHVLSRNQCQHHGKSK
jgi:hypothetical protein